MSTRQNSFPGHMNDLRSALDSCPLDSSSPSMTPHSGAVTMTGDRQMTTSDMSDPLNFIAELDTSFGKDLTDDIMTQALHSIQSN